MTNLEQQKQRLALYERLYAQVLGGADQALTELEQGRVFTAKQVLRRTIEDAEETYLQALAALLD